jgi:hypothetical protein
MFVNGTAALKLFNFSVTALGCVPDGAPIAAWAGPGIKDDPSIRLSSAKPDTAGEHGRYAQGDTVGNSAAAAAAVNGWTCSGSGELAKSWAASTAYTVGQRRKNGTNVYACTAAGTSAGAGGPTGSGIVDNTCQWTWAGLVTPAAWTASTVYTLGTVISNSGNTYRMMTSSGTSASSGGPTGVGTGIVDGGTGGCVWCQIGLQPATAWAASTVYSIIGQLVSNGASLYRLAVAGTSAASGGPTGQGIVDNTCQWILISAVATFATQAGLA